MFFIDRSPRLRAIELAWWAGEEQGHAEQPSGSADSDEPYPSVAAWSGEGDASGSASTRQEDGSPDLGGVFFPAAWTLSGFSNPCLNRTYERSAERLIHPYPTFWSDDHGLFRYPADWDQKRDQPRVCAPRPT